jgi:hypothetical protein
MKIEENVSIIKQKHLLIRQLENKLISEEEGEQQLKVLDKEINSNVIKALRESEKEIKSAVVIIKKENLEDGNLKRKIARVLIDLLESANLNDKEIKGAFRQGYKLMRD